MLVNPILLIFGLFLLGMVICFYIVRRPTRPYLSGVCLILLALFLGCTAVVNASLPPISQFDWANEAMRKLTPFVVFRRQPTQEECETSFRLYQSIDIGLVVATLLSIGYDIWNSLLRGSHPEEEP